MTNGQEVQPEKQQYLQNIFQKHQAAFSNVSHFIGALILIYGRVYLFAEALAVRVALTQISVLILESNHEDFIGLS